MWKHLALLLCLAVVAAGCAAGNDKAPSGNLNAASNAEGPAVTAADQEPDQQQVVPQLKPEEVADDIIHLLKSKDMLRLAAYINERDGVRFSPYGHVDPVKDIVLSAVEIENAMTDDTVRIWGHYDGSGEPIELTFAEYYDQFIYNVDYASVDTIGYNEILGQGNTLHNHLDIYPDSFIVEYYYPGTADNNHMDWHSLRIVLEQVNEEWVCSGIIHDQWTI